MVLQILESSRWRIYSRNEGFHVARTPMIDLRSTRNLSLMISASPQSILGSKS